jgi:cytochrome c oxidase cbb3-type subunit 3
MSDPVSTPVEFTGVFWPWAIAAVTIVSLLGCGAFLLWVGRGKRPTEGATSGHVWDGDLVELNNPLPSWWRWMFLLTLAFAAFYLWFYPGLVVYPGSSGWTQARQYESEVAAARARYAPIYDRFAGLPLAQLVEDPAARTIGRRLFLNHCTACHGSDAGGAIGYPSLRDTEWQWGGTPENIAATITYGRMGLMAGWEGSLGERGVDEVTAYVLSLSGRPAPSELASAGRARFEQHCQACHGAGGGGNPSTGALPLTDDVWRHGASDAAIRRSIALGRTAMMPPHDGFLDEAKIRLLTAYVYGLSRPDPARPVDGPGSDPR